MVLSHILEMEDELMIRSKAISLSISAALLVSVAGVAGCNTKQPANTNIHTKNVRDGHGMNGRIGVNSLRDNGMISTRGYTTKGTDGTNGMNGTNGTTHNLSNAHLSQELADKITAMKEVRSANVLVSGDSAYVAVSLHDNTSGNMGTKSIGGPRSSSFNNAGTMNGSSFNNGTTTHGMGSTGKGVHPNAASQQHGIRNFSGMGESITKGNGYNATTYGTAGTTGTGVGTGTTGTGTMGTGANGTDTITSAIKDKISNTIKSTDSSIKNVYVSANPDFVQRVSNYATDLGNGHPISGMVSELSTMIERIFPMNAGNRNTTNNNAPVHFAPTNR